MTDTDLKPKKSTRKWIYIGLGLAVLFLIVAGGGFWLWNRSKNSNKSDSTEEVEDINPEELPPEIKEYRKKNWTNRETGLWDYKIPKDLPANISASRAKDELLEAHYQWWGKSWDKKKIAKVLEKNVQRIDLADKKGNEDDPLFETKFMESIAENYLPKNIFSNLPKQNKFIEVSDEVKDNLHFLRVSFNLKYQGKKKIDWVASLQAETKRTKNKTKAQQEADFAKMTNYLEREVNPFIRLHVNKFPSLTNLKELNQWTYTLTKKEIVASSIFYKRFYLGRRMKKNIFSPAEGRGGITSFYGQKNENFNLKPVALHYKT